MEKIGTVVVGLVALLFIACNGASGSCARSSVWTDDWQATVLYEDQLIEAFRLTESGLPTENAGVYTRLNELERYCWQTRIK